MLASIHERSNGKAEEFTLLVSINYPQIQKQALFAYPHAHASLLKGHNYMWRRFKTAKAHSNACVFTQKRHLFID